MTPRTARNRTDTTPAKSATKDRRRRIAAEKRGVASPQDSQLDLAMQLMSIPGASGDEGRVAQFIQQHLVKAGAKPAEIKFDSAHKKTLRPGDVGNMLLKLPGTAKGARRLLMAHMDTVPICVGSRPKQVGPMVTSADPSTGLGADDRAGVAVVLQTAMRILRERPAHPPLTFLWTIQEEIGLFGAVPAHRDAGQALAGLQLGRGARRQSDDRCHGWVQNEHHGHRNCQSCRECSRERRQRHCHRRPGNRSATRQRVARAGIEGWQTGHHECGCD